MCGTGSAVSMRRTRPGSRPRPRWRPCSSLSSNRICMPMQMPSSVAAVARAARRHEVAEAARLDLVPWSRRTPRPPAARAPARPARPRASSASSASAPTRRKRVQHAAEVADAVVEDRDHRRALRAGDALDARVDGHRHRERARGRLEQRLGDVVRVAAAQRVEVQVEARVVGERPEEVLEELRRHGADHRRLERHVEVQERPAGEVDDAARQRLVERDVGVAEADDALLVAERLLERLAQHDAHVLDRVVRVHVQVALRRDLQVEAAVGRERRQHVVEEADARRDLRPPVAVEVERQADLGFLRAARDGGLA